MWGDLPRHPFGDYTLILISPGLFCAKGLQGCGFCASAG